MYGWEQRDTRASTPSGWGALPANPVVEHCWLVLKIRLLEKTNSSGDGVTTGGTRINNRGFIHLLSVVRNYENMAQ